MRHNNNCCCFIPMALVQLVVLVLLFLIDLRHIYPLNDRPTALMWYYFCIFLSAARLLSYQLYVRVCRHSLAILVLISAAKYLEYVDRRYSVFVILVPRPQQVPVTNALLFGNITKQFEVLLGDSTQQCRIAIAVTQQYLHETSQFTYTTYVYSSRYLRQHNKQIQNLLSFITPEGCTYIMQLKIHRKLDSEI